MLSLKTTLLALLAASLTTLAHAQSQNATLPPDFPNPTIRAPFPPTYNLTLILPKHTINNTSPGPLLPLADTQSEPKLLLTPVPASTKRFLAFMLDADQPGFGIVLHQLKTNLVADAGGVLVVNPMRADPVPFFAPGPGAGTGAHRYTFIVYEQPAGFVLPGNVNANSRISFNLAGFEKTTGVVPVAGQYFRTERK